jgi:serine/threonine-protein kinase
MTPAAACPDPRDLERLALGQLPEPVAEPLGQHVLNCSRCAERLQTFQAADPLVALLREAGSGRLPTDQPTVNALVERLVHAAPIPTDASASSTAAYSGPPAAPVARDDADGQTRTLLRRRLLVVFSILAGVGGAATVAELVADIKYEWWHWLMPGLWVGLVALMVARRLSLAVLRTCELIGFGVLWALYAYWTAVVAGADSLGRQADGPYAVTFPAYTVSLLWFALMAIYGIAIPNTWRRAAVVVGAMAATPFAVVVCTWWSDAPPVHVRTEFLLCVGFWMAEGSAIAIFASHKLTQYRQAAAQARRLGPYTLIRKLGAGGMGEVYLAEHQLLKRPCAVKLIRPDKAADPGLLQRFEREVQATAGLTHPNAVQVFDFGHTPDGTFYYAMEYLPGLNLEDLVKQYGPLPPGRAVYLLRHVCGALREAHSAGLIHRDIKPGNVIVCDRGGVPDMAKLLDFGLVRDVSGGGATLTQDGVITGTPAYLSPEQASGAKVDARADIYAVGALAYFLLTGRPPFAGPSAMTVVAAHLYELPAAPSRYCPDVPADLEAVVLRCLAKGPADRYPDVVSLDAALGACESAGQWSPTEGAAWWHSQAGAALPAATAAGTEKWAGRIIKPNKLAAADRPREGRLFP